MKILMIINKIDRKTDRNVVVTNKSTQDFETLCALGIFSKKSENFVLQFLKPAQKAKKLNSSQVKAAEVSSGMCR